MQLIDTVGSQRKHLFLTNTRHLGHISILLGFVYEDIPMYRPAMNIYVHIFYITYSSSIALEYLKMQTLKLHFAHTSI